MRTLLLMRHAKSSWKDASLPDEDRPLNKRGKTAANRMGRFLIERNLIPEAAICSPAKRARQTAKRVKKSANLDVKIATVAELYFQGPEAYLNIVSELSSKLRTALIIGHNPDLELLAGRLAGKPVRVPTATIVQVSIDGAWVDLRNADAITIEGVYRPKELDAASPQTDLRRPRRPRPSS